MIEAQILALAAEGEKADGIASALQLSVPAVEYVLARHGLVEEDDIDKDDYKEILKGIIDTAKYSQHEHLKLRAGMFIVEQKRTRENLRQAPALNILTINQLIQNSHNKVLQSLDESHNGRIAGVIEDAKVTGGQTAACDTTEKEAIHTEARARA